MSVHRLIFSSPFQEKGFYLEKWARGKRGGRFNLLKISGFSMLNISRIDFETFLGAFSF